MVNKGSSELINLILALHQKYTILPQVVSEKPEFDNLISITETIIRHAESLYSAEKQVKRIETKDQHLITK
ncbi:MAG: hypothetical protein ABIJ08_00360, partial [Nanoarchaeota archaeon]